MSKREDIHDYNVALICQNCGIKAERGQNLGYRNCYRGATQ